MRVLLLYLNGGIFKDFASIQECSRFLGIRQIPKRGLNKDSILKRNYRMVTPEFYVTHYKEIASWSNITKGELSKKLEARRKDILVKKRIVLYTDAFGNTTEHRNYFTLAHKIGLTKERVRQILKFGSKKYDITFKHPELREENTFCVEPSS